VVAVEALLLVLAAKVRVPHLERAFMVHRIPLLEKFNAGEAIERHAAHHPSLMREHVFEALCLERQLIL
jgi:hypothetical protein